LRIEFSGSFHFHRLVDLANTVLANPRHFKDDESYLRKRNYIFLIQYIY